MANVLIIGTVWPEPKSSAAGTHMMHLIAALQVENHNITFASSSQRTEQAEELSDYGVHQKQILMNDPSFDDFVKKLMPEIVIFDRFMTEEQFGWRVAEHCADAMRILNTEDLHGLRHARELAVKAGKPFDRSYYFNDTFKREIASILRCDLSLIISEYELELLKKDFNLDEALLHYFPFAIDSVSDKYTETLPSFEDRQDFISIGNFRHAPNYDAVLQLKEVIWPLIRKELPDAQLHIYGSYMPQKATELNDTANGLLIRGFADDVNSVMQQSRILLAPLRFGAGLKGKLIDAMGNGTPFVTTSIGADGLFGEMDLDGIIVDNPEKFAEKAIALYGTESSWKNYQNLGFEVLKKRFNKAEHERNLNQRIKALSENLKQHRLQNFLGAMLQHQSLQSSKYMAKWIAEKNK